MGIERIGLRRLYDALGCGIKDVPEVLHSFPVLQDCEASLYLGPKPPMGIVTLEPSEHYAVPGKQSKILQTTHDYKSDCFLEITLSLDVSVDETVSMGLTKQDEEAKNLLLSEVEKRREMFAGVFDTICGLIGLKFHRQFVLKPLFECSFIASGPVPVSRFASDFVEILEPVYLTDFGLASLKSYFALLGKVEEQKYTDASRVLQWLIRAWRERDHVAQFLYLFIPLECILGSSDEIDEVAQKNISDLKNVVANSEDVEKDVLLSFLDRVQEKFAPTLNSRFEALAQSKKIDGWEADIKAFKKFNRTRNLLLHAGKAQIESRLNINQEIRTLEDLVERYVAVSLFGDPRVYASTWRPSREITITTKEDRGIMPANESLQEAPNK